MVRAVTVFFGALAFGLPVVVAEQPQQPVFRGGVDLVTVDVVVLDNRGQPVTDLTTADFVVTADRRVRRLMSAEYVASTRARPSTAPAPAVPDEPPALMATSNSVLPSGRTFLFAIDVDGIRAGEGRGAMAGVSDYVDRLDPADRVGLVSLPYGSPRVDLTTNRVVVKQAVGQVVGAAQTIRDPEMTYGEADAIRRGDTRALLAFFERVAGVRPSRAGDGAACNAPTSLPMEEPDRVSPGCAQAADRRIEHHRRRSRALFDSLGALAEGMAPIPGQKTIVLVSEGVLNDEDTVDDLRRFAAAAERARVSLYGLHLQTPLMEAASGRTSATGGSRQLDDRLGYDSLAEVATAARGTAFRVIGAPAAILDRLDAELSGYYLLTFEREPTDRTRARTGIDVKVARDGLDVRSRREFTNDEAGAGSKRQPARPADLKAAMGELIKWPVPVAEIGIDAATFVTPAASDDRGALVLLAADFVAEGPIAAIGYEVLDATGKAVADTFDAPPVLGQRGGADTQYLVAVPLGPGSYRLKLGAIDRSGRRGSLEHAFDVAPWPGAMRASDLITGDDAHGTFRPVAALGARQSTVIARVELRAAGLLPFDRATASVAISRVGDPEPPEIMSLPILEIGDPSRRVVAARLDASAFEPGEYLVTITIRTGAGEVLTRSRRLLKP